jgi:hypothetical protein
MTVSVSIFPERLEVLPIRDAGETHWVVVLQNAARLYLSDAQADELATKLWNRNMEKAA